MKSLHFFILFLFYCLNIHAQLNTQLIGHVDFVAEKDRGNDIWGYVSQEGDEYAIVGTEEGTLIYSLEDPSNPIERSFIEGNKSVWRDIKQWGNYVYVTADAGNNGLLIIDMTNAPESIDHVYRFPTIIENDTVVLDNCHNIHIDEKGFIYLAGCGSRGSDIFDANANPWNPPYVGSVNIDYHHDNYVHNDILYASQIFQGELELYDVSDKSNPVSLGSKVTSGNFTHNAWADPSNSYVFTTDEIANGRLDAYDISDPGNIERLDVFQPAGTQNLNVIPHNTHYFNGFLVTSWYTEGVVVIDASEPDHLVQVAQYDTYEGPSGGSAGCWGVTPFLPSGLVLANDRNSGLYILDIDYKRAARIRGIVRDTFSEKAISNAEISIREGDLNEIKKTNPLGSFKIGQATAGRYFLDIKHPLYKDKSIELDLVNGESIDLEIRMTPRDKVTQEFKIVDEVTGFPLIEAPIQIFNKGNSVDLVTDSKGIASSDIITGIYTIYAGKWGYQTKELSDFNISNENYTTIELSKGYSDAFALDLGWTSTYESENPEYSGQWVRETPVGSFSSLLFNPDQDVEGDIGEKAYLTGNSVWTEHTVRNGISTLTSPEIVLDQYINPHVELSFWISALLPEEDSDIIELIFLQNGQEQIVHIESTMENTEEWLAPLSISVEEYIDKNAPFNIIIRVQNDEQPNVIKAGVDQFKITFDGLLIENKEEGTLHLYPNPAFNELFIVHDTKNIEAITIFDYTGRSVYDHSLDSPFRSVIPLSQFISGTYVARITLSSGETIFEKFNVIH